MEEGKNYRGKGKGKGRYKEAKAKANTRAKDTTKDLTTATKEATTKEGATRAKEKATQDPKDMDQTKATKAKETTAKQKGKGSNNYMTCHQCGKPGHWAQGCRVPVWRIGEGEELHPPDQEQADQDNNEELPQDLNDAWDWYYEGEEGHGREVKYMEELERLRMTTAMTTQQTTLEASTSHTSPLDTSDKQSHYHTSTNPNHYLERKQHTQHHGTTAAKAFNSSYKKTQHNCTST